MMLKECLLCDMPTPEIQLCPDRVCKLCHRSITFDDCVSGDDAMELRASDGFIAMVH